MLTYAISGNVVGGVGEFGEKSLVVLYVTFRDSSLLDTANLCPADLVMNFLFIYFDVWFCMLVHFRW